MEEVKIAPIGKFVPLPEFDARWAMFFSCEERHHDTYLPTEMVVSKPERVEPRRGRVFSTDMLFYKGEAVSSGWLHDYKRRQGESFEGTFNYEGVVLVEVYGDSGDDGHTDYNLVGYRFVGTKALEARDEWRGAMAVMLQGWNENDFRTAS